MLVYLEGVDGSGKTTLFKQLTEEYGFKGIKAPDRRDDKLKEGNDWYDFYTKYYMSSVNYIVDRGWLTELVYRKIDDCRSWLNFDLLDGLQHCKIIHCVSETSFEDSIKRGEDNITNKEISLKIEKEYFKTIKELNTLYNIKSNIILYNWHNNDIKNVIKFLNT